MTDKGMQRPANEDSLALPPPDLDAAQLARKGRLYIVADGIGGQKAGKMASELAVLHTTQHYYRDQSRDVAQSLVTAIQAASAEVYRLAQEPAYENMGTTIVAAVLREGELTVAHVGDSRAYLVRNGSIEALTQDHTWVAERLRDGTLTLEQARNHEQRHVLTRSLGREPSAAVDVRQVTLCPGDQILLCSDGLWEMVDPGEIAAMVQGLPPREAVRQLVDLANRRGGPDNVTAVAVKPTVRLSPFLPAWRSGRAAGPGRVRNLLSSFGQAQWLLLAAAAGVLLILFICAIASLRDNLQDGEIPTIEVAPVSYRLLRDETLPDIATYFELESVPDVSASTSDPVVLDLQRYALLFAGDVRKVAQDAGSMTLEVDAGNVTYQALCALNREDPTINVGATPKAGDRVAVFGVPGGPHSIRAHIVDVWQGAVWENWYHHQAEEHFWVFTAFHKYLVRPTGPEMAGKLTLVRGYWSPGTPATGFAWDEHDLFVLDQGTYTSWLPGEQRPPLATHAHEATPVPIPPTPGIEVQPTATGQAQSRILGRVKTREGLKVRSYPSLDKSSLALLADGTEIEIICKTVGSDVFGNDLWYYVLLNEKNLEGYMAAHFISLTDASPDDVPPCTE
jgi:protein phosphatase